jgi:hypothetical protein
LSCLVDKKGPVVNGAITIAIEFGRKLSRPWVIDYPSHFKPGWKWLASADCCEEAACSLLRNIPILFNG